MTLLRESSRTNFGPVKYDVVRSGRPWWQVRYTDGKELAEWETPPEVITKSARPDPKVWRRTRWEEVRKRGIIAMRLLCPNGMVGELETNNPEGRFVEFKLGGSDIGFVGGTLAGAMVSGRFSTAHLIGCVADDRSAVFWSFEREPHAYAMDLTTRRCVTCNLDKAACSGKAVTMTSREELVEHVPDPAWPERVERSRMTVTELHLEGPGPWVPLIQFRDSIDNMQYHKIGPLHLYVQGLSL